MRGIMLISCACLGLRIGFGNTSPNTSQTLRHDLGTVLVDLRATPLRVVGTPNDSLAYDINIHAHFILP
jgi:hypothetical protein